MEFCFGRKPLADPTGIGACFGETHVHGPTRHVLQWKNVEHRAIVPIYIPLQPRSGMIFFLESLPTPIFRPPVNFLIISSGADELEEPAVADQQRVDRRLKNIDEHLVELVVPPEKSVFELRTEASLPGRNFNVRRDRRVLK